MTKSNNHLKWSHKPRIKILLQISFPNGSNWLKKYAMNSKVKAKVLCSLPEISDNHRIFMNPLQKITKLSRNLIHRLTTETGTGNRKTLLTQKQEMSNNPDTLAHIAWTLWLWHCTQYGIQTLSRNVHWKTQTWGVIVIVWAQLQDRLQVRLMGLTGKCLNCTARWMTLQKRDMKYF